ncbi:uncharacterized protein N7500_006041 [Penicillium coprophilum]|uniref:uncharacterized protein n=1 Tax=Penicillium coprophilum TaxID=36646 RepID=UPI00238E2670|nr:uncharacterized protein N7500_006041 [Penicillium coprophilum]KAJ5164211.1 hypothetical protein N7500_006041 [Penicillium coprophilum]
MAKQKLKREASPMPQPSHKKAKKHTKAWFKEKLDNMEYSDLACTMSDAITYWGIILRYTSDAQIKLDFEKAIWTRNNLDSRPTYVIDAFEEPTQEVVNGYCKGT